MGTVEGDIIKLMQVEASRRGDRLWRVNVGTAWEGTFSWVHPRHFHVKPLPGYKKTLTNLRPFRTGLPKGFPDTFGFKKDRVSSLNEFFLCEVKTGKLKLSQDQKLFMEQMKDLGVNYSVVYSLDEFIEKKYGGLD